MKKKKQKKNDNCKPLGILGYKEYCVCVIVFGSV